MRLFFACWPPPEAARALAQWAAEAQRSCGGRATREAAIHLTLAFLGDADPARAQALALGLRAAPQSLLLTEARYWARNRIVWAGPAATPPGVARLARALGGEQDYEAHVTLIRKARAPGRLPALPLLEWPVREFVLVNSRPGPAGPDYEVLGRYALV